LTRAALSAFVRARQLAPLDETYTLDWPLRYDALERPPEAEWMYQEAQACDPKSVASQRYYEIHLQKWKASGSAANMDAAPAAIKRPIHN